VRLLGIYSEAHSEIDLLATEKVYRRSLPQRGRLTHSQDGSRTSPEAEQLRPGERSGMTPERE
jgi:hypothetical protein